VVSARHRPLYPGERDRLATVRESGWAHGRSGRARKITPPPVFDPRTVQPITSRYSDYAIPAHKEPIFHEKYDSQIYTRSQTNGPTDVIVSKAVLFTASRARNYLRICCLNMPQTLESFIRRVFFFFCGERSLPL